MELFHFTSKLLFESILLVLCVSLSVTTPVKQNYTDDLLLRAKAAEINSFHKEGDLHCDNFYFQVCGNWKNTYPATHDHPKTSYLGQIHNFYLNKCLNLLKKEDTTVSYQKMLTFFYKSCSDKESLALEGLRPVLNQVGLKGGWPEIQSLEWYETEYDWLKIIAAMRRKLGVDIFIGLSIIPDLDGKGLQRIKIGNPRLPLGGRAEYLNSEYDTKRLEYKENIAEKLRKHFTSMPDDWANQVANQVLDIEQQLAKGLSSDSTLNLKQSTREQTPLQLRTAYGNFVDISRYLSLVFNHTITDPIYETPENYLRNLVNVIQDTPKLVIANYTMWRVLEQLDFDGPVNDEHNDLWCAEQTMKHFPKQLADFFKDGYNALQFGHKLADILEEIKSTLKEQLRSGTKFNWMSENTRQKAAEKVDAMMLRLVHHYHEVLEQEVKDIYIAITNKRYFENILHILEWQTKKELESLKQKPKDPAEIETDFPIYIHKENKIEVPLTFMQSRFLWDPIYPNFLKYSTVGVILAHQLLRGLMDEGREYDKRGDPNKWWDTETETAFNERANCFTKQYANYKFQGKKVEDANALSKAIIDAGAISLAYHTYHNWMNNAKADELGKEFLPNINYKPHQFFFVGYGQMYCADYYYLTPHFNEIPERLRINGALTNLNDFSKEFNCQEGSRMNTKNKCELF